MSTSSHSSSFSSPTTSPTLSSTSPPSVLHKAAIREARRALESRIESTEGGLPALFQKEEDLYEYRRCRQLRVPLAAAPRSLGASVVTWAAISAAAKLPFQGMAGLLNSRMSLSLSGGLLYFNASTAGNSSLSEVCYLFALSSDSQAGRLLRSTYGTHAGLNNDFYKKAEALAQATSALSFAERVSLLAETIPGGGGGGEKEERGDDEMKKRRRRRNTEEKQQAELWKENVNSSVVDFGEEGSGSMMFESSENGEREEGRDVRNRHKEERQRDQVNDKKPLSSSSLSSKPEWKIDWGFETDEVEENKHPFRKNTSRQDAQHVDQDEPSYVTRRRRREEIAMR